MRLQLMELPAEETEGGRYITPALLIIDRVSLPERSHVESLITGPVWESIKQKTNIRAAIMSSHDVEVGSGN